VHLGELAYEAAMLAARPALAAVAPFQPKIRRGLEGRRGALHTLATWAAGERDASRPLLWLHAPSVGEALMAGAILDAARERLPELQIAFTFFSPSAERVAHRLGADVATYLPWDARRDARAALDALQPAVIGFVRTEIWPVLGREARGRGVRVALVNAVLAAGSSRTRRGARVLLGHAYRRLDAVGAVSDEDAARFARLGVAPDRVRVTGDARFDQVWQRVQRLDRGRPLLASLAADPRLTLVAGSTWPPDEQRVIDAVAGGGHWRLVIAPHEPTDDHIAALEKRLDAAGLRHARLPGLDDEAPAADVLVVDRVGVLAELYAAADAAWVGGGFGSAGLHSVVEPAALGVPVLFGPRHGNAREAHRLARAGGGFVVLDGAPVADLLARLAGDDAFRRAAGDAARGFVARHVGGAARNADILLEGTAAGRS
jgi:3-deoxy-D-manno-octulosonic-acid transferase